MNSGRTRVVEIQVKSALNKVNSAQYPDMRWSLNPYRGCKHGCVYCYARYTHTFFELDPDRDFATVIFVKRNLPEALRSDLRKLGWPRPRISIGTATDPYQPLEGRYRLTQAALKILRDQLTPASLVTKNTMCLRDADLMASLHRAAGFSLCISLITVDEALARSLEPDVPSPKQRLRVVQELARAGVPVSVAIAPVMPGLTDSEAQLRDLIQAVYDHGGRIGYHQTFRMYADTRKTLFGWLERHHPHLLPWYRRTYAASGGAPRAYERKLAARIQRLREAVAPRTSCTSLVSPSRGQLSLGLLPDESVEPARLGEIAEW